MDNSTIFFASLLGLAVVANLIAWLDQYYRRHRNQK
jgi:hypothetical protein